MAVDGSFDIGNFAFGDDEQLRFGDSNDFVFVYDSGNANLELDAAAANDEFSIGTTTATDVRFNGASAGADVLFDASGDALIIQDDAELWIGSDGDIKIVSDNTNFDIAAGSANGLIDIGRSTNTDVTFHGGSATQDLTWDASDNILTALDDAKIGFGDADDVTFSWNATNLIIEPLVQDTGAIHIGATNSMNLKIFGATNTRYCEFNTDDSASDLDLRDFALRFLDGSSTFTIGPASSNALPINAPADETIDIGPSANTDVLFNGTNAGRDMRWDASEDALTFEDTAAIKLGTGNDLIMNAASTTATFKILAGSDLKILDTDNSASKVTFGLAGGTHGLDVDFLSITSGNLIAWNAGTETLAFTDSLCTMTGANSRGTILTIVGNDASGNSDTVTINAEGTGSALKITADDVDSIQQSIICKTAQTSSMLVIDGTTTAGWTGAAGVGMVNITNDSTAVDADGTMVNILKTGNLAAANDGVCLEIEETGSAQATTYAVRISSTSNEALHIDAGEVVVDEFLSASPVGATGGLVTKYGTSDLTGTPSDAEFDALFGSTALGKAGFIGVAEDSSDGKNYLVCSDGTSWHFVAMTLAT